MTSVVKVVVKERSWQGYFRKEGDVKELIKEALNYFTKIKNNEQNRIY